jgi:putative ABC transport system permease protein
MDLLWKDIRYSIHSLRANPGFALIAILTLALGIGATTAIFSVVNGVLLQPLPLHDPDTLVMVWEKRINEADAAPNVVSPRNYTRWIPQTKNVFASMGASFDWEMSLTGQAEPELVRVGLSSASFLQTIGVKPFLGRLYNEDQPNDVVLSYALWQRKFGADPKAIGKRLFVDGEAVTVVGVMPRDFFVPKSQADLWAPYNVPNDGGRYLKVMARLKPGVTVEQAQAVMTTVAKRLEIEFPERNAHFGAIVIPSHEEVVGNVRRALLIVLASVALLLLIGCVNIANLLLSRATGRAKEMSIRTALGASRGRLVRQLLTESLVLSITAGILGILLAGWATMLLVRFVPESAMIPRTGEITVDGRVLAVSALLSLVTGIFFGLVPAVEASRTDLQSGLKSSSRGSTQDRRGKIFRNTLVVAEIALATVLLIGAGLLIKSFSTLERVRSGVDPEHVLTMKVVLPNVENNEQRKAKLTRVLETARGVPGVEHAGAIVSINMPFTNSWSNTDFRIEGEPEPKPGDEPSSDIRPIASDYFRAMGTPILEGRMLNERLASPENTEFVVNEEFAKRYFGGKAVGRRIILPWHEDLHGVIVGVVSNVRARGLETDPPAAIYLNYLQDPNTQFALVLRTSADPEALQGAVVSALRKADPLMPVSNVNTLQGLVGGTIARPRFNATMLSLFAGLGLLLASIGIYGVLSYSVAQRTQEMGIRMALGADPRDVLRLVVGDGFRVTVIGVIAGLVIAFPAMRLLASLLYGVEASDPTVFIVVALVLTVVALVASYIPARRATRVDPMIALRAE